jgi:hypothetical protein
MIVKWRVFGIDGYEQGLQRYRDIRLTRLWYNVFRSAAKCGIIVRF